MGILKVFIDVADKLLTAFLVSVFFDVLWQFVIHVVLNIDTLSIDTLYTFNPNLASIKIALFVIKKSIGSIMQ